MNETHSPVEAEIVPPTLDELDRRTAVLDAEVKQTLLRVAATRKRAAEYLERKLKQEALEKEAAARAKADERKP